MGDCATLLELLPSATNDEERFARGWCLIAPEPEHGLRLLSDLGDGVLGEYARLLRGEALLGAGRPEEALTAVAGLSLPGDAGLRVRLARSRALISLGRSIDAREDLRALLSTSVSGEARYLLAKGGEDRGEQSAAIATYRATWANSLLGPWADLSQERLVALGAPIDASTEDGRSLMRERARQLSEAQRSVDGLPLILAVEAADAQLSGLELARWSFKGRDYPGAVALFREALGAPEEATGSAQDLFNYALGTSRVGDYDAAGVIYRRLIALHGATKQADQASFKLGYLEYDRRDCTAARPLFEAHVAERPDSTHLDEALWFSARCAWQTGDISEATADLNRLISLRPKSSLVSGATYWKARALGVEGDPEAEARALAQVISWYPTSGYAWFAAARLGRSFPSRDRVPRPEWPAELAINGAVQRGEALLGVGFTTWARAELHGVKTAARGSKAGALAAAHALIAAGDYRGGQALAQPWCVSAWKESDPVVAQACNPMPEATIVYGVAARYGLPALLPFGIMKAESALRPEVTSLAGARGLMQIMPAEGGRIHAELTGSESGYDADNLYSPSYNAAMGTTELGMKFSSLNATLTPTSLPAVIASYNGGEEAVRRWVAAYDTPPEFDTFAEDVGYTETRRYIKSVLGYVMAYRWVYGDP